MSNVIQQPLLSKSNVPSVVKTTTGVWLATITPEVASAMLLLNKNNRAIAKRRVWTLAEEMRKGRWSVNGHTIKFSDEPRLLDGQHRLSAVVKSGVTIQSWVASGLDQSEMLTIDNLLRARSSKDALELLGHKDAKDLAAITRKIYAISRGMADVPKNFHNTPTNQDVANWVEANPRVSKSVDFAKVTYRASDCGISRSDYGAFHFLFSQVNPGIAESFLTKVATGLGMEGGKYDPAYPLRKKLIRDLTTQKGMRLKASIKWNHIIYAWNATLEKRPLSKFGSSSFPEKGILSINGFSFENDLFSV